MSKIITLYIKSTGKNTFISLLKKNPCFFLNRLTLNPKQLILITYSCGYFGFKGRAKETAFACNFIITKILLLILKLNYRFFHIIFKGIGSYRKIILSTILNFLTKKIYLKLLSITDITQSSFNGSKYKKQKKY